MNWDDFNTYISVVPASKRYDFRKEFVSATRVRNYLMRDPLLDWFRLYYDTLGFNSPDDRELMSKKPAEWSRAMEEARAAIQKEYSSLNILFEKGNRFESLVVNHLTSRYPTECVTILQKACPVQDIHELYAKQTMDEMKKGTPIIFQAPLINYSNRTFGIADIILRSDWVNILFPFANYEFGDVSAEHLEGDYHYVVIDIKWSTIPLTVNELNVQNCKMYPAYKGQLAIYTAAIGQMQGYTPDKAFLLGKAWKSSSTRGGTMTVRQGYNCFHSLGHIDFNSWDNKYLKMTHDGISWIRDVRYNGQNWQVLPIPSRPELYPNMNNTQYDSPYHSPKKAVSDKIDELTSVWRIEVKHRETAHSQGVLKWSDPRCTPNLLGIKGDKVAPTLNQVLGINRDNDPLQKVWPESVTINHHNWQERMDIEFFVDFEAMQSPFDPSATMNILDSHDDKVGALFMIGVGYEDEFGRWVYRSFNIEPCSLKHIDTLKANERKMVAEFQQFIVDAVNHHIEVHQIAAPELCQPKLFHWGHAERTLIGSVCANNSGLFDTLNPTNNHVEWVDMLKVFWDEPIVVKGAKRFGLKEIAGNMKKLGLIETEWPSLGPGDGLEAMVVAINYFNLLEEASNVLDPIHRKQLEHKIAEGKETYENVIRYNEVDCKSVWEIVTYLRNNHVNNEVADNEA